MDSQSTQEPTQVELPTIARLRGAFTKDQVTEYRGGKIWAEGDPAG